MQRSLATEIMDDPGVPEHIWERFHRQLGFVHQFLGNHRAILEALRRDARPIRRVLDIGCGDGALLYKIHRALHVEVAGVDLRPPAQNTFGVPIVAADATRDRLPEADVAVCITVVHHLREEDILALVRNARRSLRRLIILDLVRHWLPLALFRIFLYPFLNWTVAVDGVRSVRRAYTATELRAIIEHALAGSFARVEHTVTPLRSRQMIDISWS
jgi:2-polyprenyl-3-methyl-5-hydroxy-6-metoxy-1,4-benzoquinol methylase